MPNSFAEDQTSCKPLSDTICSCGEDHAALVREVLAHQRASHPWEVDYHKWSKKQGGFILSEETYRLELSRLD
jgi:hypothetical protein